MTFSKTITAALAAAGSVFAASAADAGSIFTPALLQGSGNQIICIATNTTNAPLTVTVRIFGVVGSAAETCTLDPGDGGGCQAFRNNDAGYCRISVTGLTNAQVAAQVRGVLIARRTTSPFTIDAVVEAR